MYIFRKVVDRSLTVCYGMGMEVGEMNVMMAMRVSTVSSEAEDAIEELLSAAEAMMLACETCNPPSVRDRLRKAILQATA